MKLFAILISIVCGAVMPIWAQSIDDKMNNTTPSEYTFQEIEPLSNKPSTRFAPGDLEEDETAQKVELDAPIGNLGSMGYLLLLAIINAYLSYKRTNSKQTPQ